MASVARNLSIFVSGWELSCVFTSFTSNGETDMLDTTTLCKSSKTYTAGLKNGTISASGVWESDPANANKIHDIMQAAFVNQWDLPITATKETAAVGNRVLLAQNAKVSSFNLPVDTGTLITLDAEFQQDNGLEHGILLFDGTDAAVGTNGSTVDNAAGTTNGGLFIAHVYLESDSVNTDGAFTLQHSTDGSTWADLIASTAVGGNIGSISSVVAAGTTVNRYLRAVFLTTTGKGYGVASFVRR